MRDGFLIEREFSGKDYPSTMNTVFIGDIRFTRGADNVFRADSDDTVRTHEEANLRSFRNTALRNTEPTTHRTITFDGQDGLFSPSPIYRMIEGKKVIDSGQEGWFYPYPPTIPVDPALAAKVEDCVNTINRKR